MSHTGVEVFDFLLYSIYPVIGLLAIALIYQGRRAKISPEKSPY